MPLPNDFSESEFLQDLTLRIHNRAVREWFSDIELDDDIESSRGALKRACLMQPDDSWPMIQQRQWLFEVVCRHASSLMPEIYGIPVLGMDTTFEYKPQVKLYFSEPSDEADPDYGPVTGEITFRLMNETSSTISQAEVNSLANKIKLTFGAGSGYSWRKGKTMLTYHDKPEGYALNILCNTETEGKDLIRDVLSIRDKIVDTSKLRIKQADNPTEAFPEVTGTQVILGKTYRKPRRYPIARVRFRYATLLIHGLGQAITLVDLTGTRRNPIVTF